MFKVSVEYTDTYGGEANYCWVQRASLTLPAGISDLAIMRRAKAAMGISGARGRTENHGDSFFVFRPWRSRTVMFVATEY